MPISLGQVQRLSQKQVQKMSQAQIQSLKILAMGSQDLAKEIYTEVERNPALEIVGDPLADGVGKTKSVSNTFGESSRYGASSSSGSAKSDAFQEVLESQADNRQTLSEHLLQQFNVMRLSDDEIELGQRLIQNLDKNGFHILAPVSLLDKNRPAQNQAMLSKCLDIIHRLDPQGVCCQNYEESLYIQATIREDASFATLFILDGHFDFLNPPIPSKVAKKIESFVEENKKLSFNKLDIKQISEITEDDIVESLAYIKTLEPFPAQDYGTESAPYIEPDVYVDKVFDDNQQISFRIRVAKNILPKVEVSKDFNFENASKASKEEKKFVDDAIKNAKVFLESLEYRNETIANACQAIVEAQKPFFEKGPRFLLPLRQKDIAEKIKVHETTISRMSGSKYIQCEWGLFAIKYFFTNAVGTQATSTVSSVPSSEISIEAPSTDSNASPKTQAASNSNVASISSSETVPATALSKTAVKYEIAEILSSLPVNSKPLSDQKISDILAAKGIKVARRTVAKYRNELQIESSYNRT